MGDLAEDAQEWLQSELFQFFQLWMLFFMSQHLSCTALKHFFFLNNTLSCLFYQQQQSKTASEVVFIIDLNQ